MPYPEEEDSLRDLVLKGHAELDDEPLLVAIYYASDLVPDEECLFEVARDFGFNEVSDDHEIFEIQFNPGAGLPLPPNRRLRLLLTNPVEFNTGISHIWRQVKDLKDAIAHQKYKVLYQRAGDKDAEKILQQLEVNPIAA